MKKSYGQFERKNLTLRPLAERRHDLNLQVIKPLQPGVVQDKAFLEVAAAIHRAVESKSSRLLMMGAHVLRAGVQNYLIDLMERGFISGIAANGAAIIHDFEFALIGATTESVAHYIKDGSFGLWRETGRINDIISQAAAEDLGAGEAIGAEILNGKYPHKDISIFAAAHRLGIPITVHVGIGYDIVHEHQNCDGAAWGQTSYLDFLRFVHLLESLENGAIMNFGSAVMAPEVFLKALAMVRNVAVQQGKIIDSFTTLVCDLKSLPGDYCREAPRHNPDYYFRPWKTMLVRSLAGQGQSFYVQGNHSETIPQLWNALNRTTGQGKEW